ncbi:Uxx-star family glutaredoxin-like (seleno)protein [Methanoregula sp.]|uniref:Uxx-star family glutaredoxin-like (seleno)protein n=1 Tax=Methanoregula sp. TaxID=2052170 RepID=UPI000CC792CB|nr:Uxx-star family glutaredoxin-like (seleno)protein [Methanoregula sp.]PKG32583.1 MAG: glutaredoxin [Methanoregula sp.]
MTRVTVYSTRNCPYCRMAKAFLDKYGVPYESIDVGADPGQAQKMIEISGQRGVPVIVVDSEVIVGFDAGRLTELFGTEEAPDRYDVLIIGAGPAGLTAGVYCARKMLNTLIISENIGGQALESWAIENYMGYRMVTGEDLMKKFEEQVKTLNIRLELDRVTAVAQDQQEFTVKTASGKTIRARALILTQGKRARKLDVLGEDRFIGRGISICSTCDGPLYKGKKVAVVGGGNSALQTAIEMSRIASSVNLIVRSSIRADPISVERLKTIGSIVVHEHTHVTALHGEQFLTGVTIRDGNGVERMIDLDGIFVEIGWIPNTEILDGLVNLNDRREVIVDINCCTSRPGVFAAGDITNEKSKQIIIAAGDGAKAALEAYEYLMAN